MRSLRALAARVLGVFATRAADRDFDAELESHLQLHVDDNIRSGMTPGEARRRAVLALGGVDQTREIYRDRRGIPMIETVLRDLRHGARGLWKTPGFSLAAIVILGLGIGVNTAIFTVVNAVVLRPLPFPDADRIVRLWHTPPPQLFPGHTTFSLSPANFLDWQAQSRSFERMAMYRGYRRTLVDQGEPEAMVVGIANADFFAILDLRPILGRGFTADDDREGAAKTALLSEVTWRTRFGADPAILGRPLAINGEPFTVIGVVPRPPAFANTIQMWVTPSLTAADRAVRDNHNWLSIARLKPGVSVAGAQDEMTTISKRLEQQYPADNKDWGALVRPLREDIVGDARVSLLVLLGAVAFVLLIACANLANLMLVRTHARAREIAVCSALGASRGRVVQQLLADGLLLGVGGGIAGFAASYLGLQALIAAFGEGLPRAAEVVPDARVLAFTAAVAILTGLAAAAAPAWQMTRRDLNDILKRGPGRGTTASGDRRVRNLLVVAEVALALMLLVGAGLLMRSLAGLRAVDPGFEASHLLTATVDVPMAKYATPEACIQVFDRMLEKVRALPGVESAAMVDSPPLRGGSTVPVAVAGAPARPQSELPAAAARVASPRYFATARIPVLEGRDFGESDVTGRPLVAIVSERAAQQFWPGERAIGKRLALTLFSMEMREVVGVVRDVKIGDLDERNPEPGVYLPVAQVGYPFTTLVIRTTGDPELLSRSVIAAVRTVDPEQAVQNLMSMETVVEESLGQRPFAMLLLAAFAALALALASVGIYSVIAYTVRQRVREIGIRVALGAPARQVLGMVVVEGLKPTLAGVAAGMVLAALLVRLIRSELYGVSAYDPATFALVAGIVLIVGIVATLVPAWRATRVDPIVTLRAE